MSSNLKQILIELDSSGYSQSSIERVLELPTGTLDKENPETLALMRIVKTFPWLLKVADEHFNELESKRIMCHSAIDVMTMDVMLQKLEER
jgi:hypothetical protein